MKRFNFNAPGELHTDDDDPPGFRASWASIHRAIDSERLRGNLLEVTPGNAATSYHWESPNEEWLVVLEGSPTVRTPAGEEVVAPGDIVCFAPGPAGAHQVINDSDLPVRILMISDTGSGADVVVYPDSDKVAVWTPHEEGVYRLTDAVDYWQGEAG